MLSFALTTGGPASALGSSFAGPAADERQMEENPVAFMSLVGRILPLQEYGASRALVPTGNVNLSVVFVRPSDQAETKLIDVTPTATEPE